MTNYFTIGHIDSDSNSSKPISGFKDGSEDLETSRIGLISGNVSVQLFTFDRSATELNSIDASYTSGDFPSEME